MFSKTHTTYRIWPHRAIRASPFLHAIKYNIVSRAGRVWGRMSTCVITISVCAQTQSHIHKNTHNIPNMATPCDPRVSIPPCHQVQHCITRWAGLEQYEYVCDHHICMRANTKPYFQKHTQQTIYDLTVRSARLHSSIPSSTTLYHTLGGSGAV